MNGRRLLSRLLRRRRGYRTGELHLHIDVNHLQLDHLLALESASLEGLSELRAAKEVLWPFVANGDGEYLPEAEARALVGRLSIAEVARANRELKRALSELGALAVNPTNGDSSSSP